MAPHNQIPYNILKMAQDFNRDLLQTQSLINNDTYTAVVAFYNNNIYAFKYFIKPDLDEIDITRANRHNTLQTLQTYFTIAIFYSNQSIERLSS